MSKSSIHVAVGKLHVELPGCHSLKQKRKIVRPLVKRLRDRFGVSASEVGLHDLWQSAIIAVAAVGTTPSQLNSLIDDAMRFAQRNVDGVIVETGIEMLSAGEFHQGEVGAGADGVDASGIEKDWLEGDS